MDLDAARTLLAPNGVLRVAINTGNKALVQQEDGQLRGVSPDLARRFADELGVRAEMTVYKGAGMVVKAAEEWDLAFLAADPDREHAVAFSAPYVIIEGTYAVRADGPISRVENVDQPGRSVLVATGAAYDLALTRLLKHASIQREPNPPASFERFLNGHADAVAGVRQSLESRFNDEEGVVVLDGRFLAIGQTMAVPRGKSAALPVLEDFLRRAKAEGFVRASLDASGRTSLPVAGP